MSLNDFFTNKIEGNLTHQATECQKRVFRTLSEFVSDNDRDILVVNGYAGTGKTSAIAAFVEALKEFKVPYKLMAPTGRAAKVLSGYSGSKALTIHKQIYRQKNMKDGMGIFSLDMNKNKDTVFIVDEASLISIGSHNQALFGTGNLLADLIFYVRSNSNNKLILVGDDAQLPPVGFDRSPALDVNYLSTYGDISYVELTGVVRQADKSGILMNATVLRHEIKSGNSVYNEFPKLNTDGYNDIRKITGGELLEVLGNAIDKYGLDNTVVLCRSNKRANRYNNGIRSSLLFREERLSRGDKLMVVKNCYQFLEEVADLDFIANGDVAELLKISKFEERYGLEFAEAQFIFPDYNNVEITAKVILDTLESESPSLSAEQQKNLFEGVFEDYADIKTKRKRYSAVREDLYYNALQIKYATAITCHKSQGGQWDCVFIDNAFWGDDMTLDDKKWLYTALTRAVKEVYLVNFNKKFF